MSVTTQTPHAPTRLARVRRRLARCDRLRRTGPPSSVQHVADREHNPAATIQTPAGPEAAEHALSWLARQARWQSTFADLERP